jgi:hypothetical protein
MDFYRLCLKAEQQGQRADVTACREQAATDNGYAGWTDFTAKAKAALPAETWIRIQREAHGWYKEQPGAGGPGRGGPGGPVIDRKAARPPALKDWNDRSRAEFILRPGAPPPPDREKIGDPTEEVMKRMAARMAELRIDGFEAVRKEDGTIHVLFPPMDEEELAGARSLLLMQGEFRFRLLAEPDLAAKHAVGKPPVNHEWLDYFVKDKGRSRALVMIDDGANFGSETIKTAYVATDGAGFPAVGFHIRKEFQDRFHAFTSEHSETAKEGAGRRLALVMDGRILSAPMIRAGIRTGGVISAGARGFSLSDQKNLITVLNSEPYPVALELVEERRDGRVVEPKKPAPLSWDEAQVRIRMLVEEGVFLRRKGVIAVAGAESPQEKEEGYLTLVKAYRSLREAIETGEALSESPEKAKGEEAVREIEGNLAKCGELMAQIRKNLPLEYIDKLD